MAKQRLLLFALVVACIGVSLQPTISVSAQTLIESVQTKSQSQDKSDVEYRIKAGDLLDVSIERVCIYNPRRTVNDRGKIAMFLIGEVQAEGITAKELEAEITAQLNEYFIDPKVHIHVKERRTLTTD
jgi:protein involved in polysaccharide export with SLBB domain